MIYITNVVPVEALRPENRQKTLDESIDRMARERGRFHRATLESQPGRLLPPVGERIHGDLILMMVDEGEGERVCEEITKQMDVPTLVDPTKTKSEA